MLMWPDPAVQIASYLNRLASDLEAAAYPALDGLTNSVTSHNLERVRRIKGRLVRLTKRVETVRQSQCHDKSVAHVNVFSHTTGLLANPNSCAPAHHVWYVGHRYHPMFCSACFLYRYLHALHVHYLSEHTNTSVNLSRQKVTFIQALHADP